MPQRASEFVRRSIFSRSGVLMGASSGMEVDELLPSHRGLEHDDVLYFSKLLERLLRETR